FAKPDSKVLATEVIVSAKGFVQLRERFLLEEAVILPGKNTEVDFVLARGEVLSGKAELPLYGAQKAVGIKPEERQFALAIRGPSFKEYYLTEPGGRFEVWVPRGKYTIEVEGGGRGYPVRQENVPSGSTDLKLAPNYPRPGEKELANAFDAL